MSTNRKHGRLSTWFTALIAGGILLQAGGCDKGIQDSVLTGMSTSMQTLATTLIDALFQSMAADDDGAVTTVKAVFDQIQTIFC